MADAAWRRFWRVFPWDPAAERGAPFSPEYIIPAERQTKGRFDLGITPVLYLAESPEHAVSELLRSFIGRPLRPVHLIGAGHPLALVEVQLDPDVSTRVADLTDPAVLLRYGVRPDVLASRNRAATQSVSRSLFDHGLAGRDGGRRSTATGTRSCSSSPESLRARSPTPSRSRSRQSTRPWLQQRAS